MARRPDVTIGDLRDLVALQARTATPDGSDDYTESYSTVASVWAKVEEVSGGRVIDGAQVEQRVTHELTIRHRTDVTAWRWILLSDGRRLRVQTTSSDPHRRWLTILAEEETRS